MLIFDKIIKKILLINPPYTFNTYIDIDRKAGTMQHPLISLASIAGALKDVCEVKILDFDIIDNSDYNTVLNNCLDSFNPDLVGITATTPVFPALLKVAEEIKKYNKDIIVVSGGVHTSTCPEEAVNSKHIDIAVIGEADFFLKDLITSKNRFELKGAYFKKSENNIIFNGRNELINDLDTLPFPAWELYDLSKYKASRLIERKSPGGLLETSRGCPFLCNYCNKTVFGRKWRYKSINRVIEEFKIMKKLGFQEIHIEDDGFSTDIERAKNICKEIIKCQLNINWTLLNGIRVDRVDRELFGLLKESGCYQVAFGIESGDETVLKLINKNITLNQIQTAVQLATETGLQTFGFFMFGLLGETEETMKKTIEFAKSLQLTIAKFDIAIPYPGTDMFNELEKLELIKDKNWINYLVHNNKKPIFMHPNMDWKIIRKYYKIAYRKFYFRFHIILNHFILSIKDGSLFEKIKYFINTKW